MVLRLGQPGGGWHTTKARRLSGTFAGQTARTSDGWIWANCTCSITNVRSTRRTKRRRLRLAKHLVNVSLLESRSNSRTASTSAHVSETFELCSILVTFNRWIQNGWISHCGKHKLIVWPQCYDQEWTDWTKAAIAINIMHELQTGINCKLLNSYKLQLLQAACCPIHMVENI